MKRKTPIKKDPVFGGSRPAIIRCIPSEGLVVWQHTRPGSALSDISRPRKGDVRFVVRGLLAARNLSAVAAAIQKAFEKEILQKTILAI